jgi:beta-phosphoglucomutase-like phosphatase (HAD superfamily)
MARSVIDLIDFPAFDAVVPGDEVDHPKPHPEPYLKASRILGVDIADVLVIEDSPTGLSAGISSGAVTLGVPHIVPLDGLGAHALWPTLEGRTASDIVDLYATVTSVERGR